eukprot:TRINITY_DN1477_c0_g1_i1.p1 TRINITY_DN1477_c0_g1~~TRINITY_DN1477_c0_g1_i1.p1  ORF type:complete len:123 (-),score=16.05 TRINITY_DN1477_c0_g1_i1:29-373(-)
MRLLTRHGGSAWSTHPAFSDRRMTVLRLQQRQLLLCYPVFPSAVLLHELEALGHVHSILADDETLVAAQHYWKQSGAEIYAVPKSHVPGVHEFPSEVHALEELSPRDWEVSWIQ